MAWFPVGDGVRRGCARLLLLEGSGGRDDGGISWWDETSGNGRIIDLADDGCSSSTWIWGTVGVMGSTGGSDIFRGTVMSFGAMFSDKFSDEGTLSKGEDGLSAIGVTVVDIGRSEISFTVCNLGRSEAGLSPDTVVTRVKSTFCAREIWEDTWAK